MYTKVQAGHIGPTSVVNQIVRADGMARGFTHNSLQYKYEQLYADLPLSETLIRDSLFCF